MKVTYDAEVDVLRILLSNAPIKPSRIPRSRSRLTASWVCARLASLCRRNSFILALHLPPSSPRLNLEILNLRFAREFEPLDVRPTRPSAPNPSANRSRRDAQKMRWKHEPRPRKIGNIVPDFSRYLVHAPCLRPP